MFHVIVQLLCSLTSAVQYQDLDCTPVHVLDHFVIFLGRFDDLEVFVNEGVSSVAEEGQLLVDVRTKTGQRF